MHVRANVKATRSMALALAEKGCLCEKGKNVELEASIERANVPTPYQSLVGHASWGLL